VLAYSTMSQLGYMFMGEAVGGFSTGIFHLTTHAYFKALLFMSAGAVIHALAGEQDMRKMGGLRRKLPTTFWCFLAGGLALSAFPLLSGFWSKDAILGAILERASTTGAGGWYLLYAVGIVTAFITSFYTFRLIFGVFWGSYRGSEIVPHGAEHGPPAPAAAPMSRPNGRGREASARRDPLARVHDVGATMRWPMLVLAVLSVVGGFVSAPFPPFNNWLGVFLAPDVGTSPEASGGALALTVILGIAALLGIVLAWMRYGARQASFAPTRNPIVVLLQHRYYVDAIYDHVIVRPLLWIGRLLRRDVEGVALDGGTRGVGNVVGWSSGVLRALQTGYARNYALAIFLGAALIVVYYVMQR
jgi:NADH-quinone oxidoreductase subunit L